MLLSICLKFKEADFFIQTIYFYRLQFRVMPRIFFTNNSFLFTHFFHSFSQHFRQESFLRDIRYEKLSTGKNFINIETAVKIHENENKLQ